MFTSKNTLIFLSICLLSLILIFAFRNPNTIHKSFAEKEYMTILISSDEKGQNLTAYISLNGEKYSKESLINADNPSKGNFDFNPIVKLLNEYRRGGWEIISNNLSVKNQALSDVTLYNYFLLERENPNFKKN